jgi:hypothetical protein
MTFSWNNAAGPRVSCLGTQWRCFMWISFFGIATAAAIGLSVVAIMLQETSGRKSLS